MALVAETDAAAGRLRLAGDCRMADLPMLSEALAKVRAAAPGVLQIDLTRADEFDIGPAWLLRAAPARRSRSKASRPVTSRSSMSCPTPLPRQPHRRRNAGLSASAGRSTPGS